MKITYTGRNLELSPAHSQQVTEQFEKVAKLLDTEKGEAQAHVVLSHDKLTHSAEVTVHYHHHELVGHGEGADVFTALHSAVEKLEKQAHRVREKFRDAKRTPLSDAESLA